MFRLPAIEPLEARIAPALITVNPLADILVGAAQKNTIIDLEQVIEIDAQHPNRTVVKFSLNLDLDPLTPGIQNDTDPFTPGIQPPQIVIELYDDEAPLTVQNFLRYVQNTNKSGDYTGTYFHRAAQGFVLQGGGYNVSNDQHIPTFPTVHNEYSPDRSNLRGTVAMAKVGDDPNSATSEWFVNLGDNSQNLDNQNGGFTVFGEVISGMEYVDMIVGLLPANVIEGVPRQNTGLSPADNVITITGATIERPSGDPNVDTPAKYEIVGITHVEGNNVVTGKITGSQLKLNYTGNPGVADITIKFTNPDDPDDFTIDTFRVTAQPNLITSITGDTLRANLPANFGVMIVPGEKGTVTLAVTNNGGATYKGTIDLSVFLSKADGYDLGTRNALGPDPKGLLLDAAVDDLIGMRQGVSVTIASGATATFSIPVTVTEELVPGFDAYRMLAEVTATSGTELYTDDNIALNGAYHGLVSEFGFVASRNLGVLLSAEASGVMTFIGLSNAKLSVRTSEGNLATFSFTGIGTGRFSQSDGTDLTILNTTPTTVLNLTSKDIIDLNNIDVSTTIGTVNFKSTKISGYMTFSGGVKVLNLGDIDGTDKRLILGTFNSLNSVGATLSFGLVHDLSIESDQPIASLTAAQWLDTGDITDSIVTSSLGKLNITGRAATAAGDPAVTGDFQARLAILGRGTTASVVVKGSMADAIIQSGGKITKMTLGEMIDSSISADTIRNLTVTTGVLNSYIEVAGVLGTAKFATMQLSDIRAGALNSLVVNGGIDRATLGIDGKLGTFRTSALTNALISTAAGITSFTVTGELGGSAIETGGNVGTVTIGAMFDSTFFAGVHERPAALEDFQVAAKISSFTIKGIGAAPTAFFNSQVAALNIGKIIVKGVDSSSPTGPFGFVADKVNSYQRGTVKLTNQSQPAVLDEVGEYSLTVL